tara:strand:+ start:166 stop:378 length:213 start_codon:yes stop_codon:yes gene_type:complete
MTRWKREEELETVAFDEVLFISPNGGAKLLIAGDEVWLPIKACPGLENFDVGAPGEYYMAKHWEVVDGTT